MTDEFFTIYQAHGDGGNEVSLGPVIAYRSTQSQAKAIAKGAGWWGSDGGVTRADAVRIDGNVYVLQSVNPVDLDGHQKARQRTLQLAALNKLTAEEIEALGLKDLRP